MSARRVPVNAAALLIGRITSAVVAVIVASIAAHRLDLPQFGLMASTMAAGFLANALVTFGTDTVVTRAVAAGRADAGLIASASLRMQLSAAAVLAVVAAFAVLAGADVAVFVQAMALVPLAVVTVTGAVLRGQQRMDRLLIANVVGGVTTLLALIALFSTSVAAWVPIAAFALGSIATAAVSWWFLAGYPVGLGRNASLLGLVRETTPFAAMVILAAVGAQAGVLLVEFASDESAGGYGVAVRLSEAARLVPAAAMGAFFPAMLSGLHRTDRYRRWMRWLFAYACLATVAMILLAEPVNRLVFDNQPGGAALIRILALGLTVTVARLALSFELIATSQERLVLMSALAGALITVIAGALVAQRFGAQGVAWAQLTGLLVATLLLLWRRVFRSSPDPESATLPLV